MKDYLWIFFISMVPLIELRGAIPVSQVLHLPIVQSYIICIIGNMLPVPIIYLFARKVLEWGADKPVIGKFFTWCLERARRVAESFRKRPAEVCFWHCFCLSEFHFREQGHGPERLRQVFWTWISSPPQLQSCWACCWQALL